MTRSAATSSRGSTPGPTPPGPPGSTLARSDDAEVLAAWEHRDRLVHAAADVVAACGHDPDLACCSSAGCHLAALTDGTDLCVVAHDLTRLPDAPRARRHLSPAEAVAEFRACLIAAADAIRHCRQAEHGTGVCWFAPEVGGDGCRQVLRLLHAAS